METSTSTKGFRNNGSRIYGMLLSTANVIQVPLSALLEYIGILRGRPHYQEIEGIGGGSVREREDGGGGTKVSIIIIGGFEVSIRHNFSTKP